MKANNEDPSVPTPLREVWAWKDAVFHATEKMTTAKALRQMHADAAAVRKTFGLAVAEPRPANQRVAESPAKYGKA